MRDDFGSLFALNAALRSDPSPSVLSGGLPCGPFDQKLLNELFFTLSSTLSELNTVLDAANIVPDETSVNQLVGAIAKIAAANSPTIAQASVTLWVRTDGNDTNADGSANSAAKAFQTIGAAIKYGLSRYVFAGFSLIIKLGLANTGSNPYAPPGQINGAGNVTITGNDATANNYVIGGAGSGTNSALVLAGSGSQILLTNCTIQNTGSINHSVGSVQGGSLTLQNTAVQATVNTSYSQFFAFSGGNTSIQSGCSVTCAVTNAVLLADYGIVILNGTLAVTGSPTSSTAFAYVRQGALRFGAGSSFSTNGTPSGKSYLVAANGVIDTGGLGTPFPGTTAGSTQTGGQYI